MKKLALLLVLIALPAAAQESPLPHGPALTDPSTVSNRPPQPDPDAQLLMSILTAQRNRAHDDIAIAEAMRQKALQENEKLKAQITQLKAEIEKLKGDAK